MTADSEFSFFVDCDHLKEADKTYEISASEEECAALAERFGLLGLERLQASAVVSRLSSRQVLLECGFSADLSQACVVSSKPVESHVEGRFEQIFDASAEPYYGDESEPEGEEGTMGEEAVDPPEPMIDGGFDLGEAVAEQLSLEIDPYPRSPDAVFAGYSSAEDGGEDGADNPFAVLRQLKKKS